MSQEFKHLSGRELAAGIASGSVSSREVLEYFLERIAEHNPRLNAVVKLDKKGARARAKQADDKRARGEPLGPLHGVPMTIKDGYAVRDMVSTGGSMVHKNHIPKQHSAVVQRLEDAGVNIIGKTNVPLYSGDWQSYNDVYGTSNNPWDVSRTPGGSSGGSASALAMGMTPLEYGSDIGGSIRTPAHFCGVYGHKPSFDVVPLRGYIASPEPGLSTRDLSVAGPLARSVDDLEALFSVTAGADILDESGWNLQLPASRITDIKKMRVAVMTDFGGYAPVDSAVLSLMRRAADKLAKAGARVEEKKMPVDIDASMETYMVLLNAIIGSGVPPEVKVKLRQIVDSAAPDDRSWKVLQARGMTCTYAEWLQMHERRTQARHKWRSFFRQWDCVMMPVQPTAAFRHDHNPDFHARTQMVNGEKRPYLEALVWAMPATLHYLPATVIPVGVAKNNLPVGVQLIGDYLQDYSVLACARLADAVIGGYRTPPKF